MGQTTSTGLVKCCQTPTAATVQSGASVLQASSATPIKSQKPRRKKISKPLETTAFDPQANDLLRLTPSKRKLILRREEGDDPSDENSSPKPQKKKAAVDVEEAQENLVRGALRGDAKAIQRALASGASPSTPNARGLTPLMQCAGSQGATAVEALKLLVEHGASLDDVDSNGWTALHHVCRSGTEKAAKYLLSVCQDLCLVTRDKLMKTPLMLAVEDDKLDVVTHVVQKVRKVNNHLNVQDAEGCTALHHAMRKGQKNIVKVLLESQAKTQMKNSEGQKPLMLACEHGRLDCVKLLWTSSGKSISVNSQDNQNRTALMLACMNCHEDVALFLVNKCNADKLATDIHGDTAVKIARHNGLSKAVGAMTRKKEDDENGDKNAD